MIYRGASKMLCSGAQVLRCSGDNISRAAEQQISRSSAAQWPCLSHGNDGAYASIALNLQIAAHQQGNVSITLISISALSLDCSTSLA
jgi:hypothetical protein